ncbi:hypothetical protein GCK32_012334 [Trichostrongylus colubriformis]|uniref:Uncharacterized protein n=1 Tax=Trichostrongylus colubriformis TaxID=6319 RepID=A0AAN8IV47_TRICO
MNVGLQPIPGRALEITCTTLEKDLSRDALLDKEKQKHQEAAVLEKAIRALNKTVNERLLKRQELSASNKLLRKRVELLKAELETRQERKADFEQVERLKLVFIGCEFVVIFILSIILGLRMMHRTRQGHSSAEPMKQASAETIKQDEKKKQKQSAKT